MHEPSIHPSLLEQLIRKTHLYSFSRSHPVLGHHSLPIRRPNSLNFPPLLIFCFFCLKFSYSPSRKTSFNGARDSLEIPGRFKNDNNDLWKICSRDQGRFNSLNFSLCKDQAKSIAATKMMMMMMTTTTTTTMMMMMMMMMMVVVVMMMMMTITMVITISKRPANYNDNSTFT